MLSNCLVNIYVYSYRFVLFLTLVFLQQVADNTAIRDWPKCEGSTQLWMNDLQQPLAFKAQGPLWKSRRKECQSWQTFYMDSGDMNSDSSTASSLPHLAISAVMKPWTQIHGGHIQNQLLGLKLKIDLSEMTFFLFSTSNYFDLHSSDFPHPFLPSFSRQTEVSVVSLHFNF